MYKRSGDEAASKRRHSTIEEATSTSHSHITTTPLTSKRVKRTASADDDDESSSVQPQQDNLTTSTPGARQQEEEEEEEAEKDEVSPLRSNNNLQVVVPSPQHHHNDDKMRAGSPDSGIETLFFSSASSDAIIRQLNSRAAGVAGAGSSSSGTSQDAVSNADSCLALSVPTSPEQQDTSGADSPRKSEGSSSVDKSSEVEVKSNEDKPRQQQQPGYRLCLERPPEPKPAEPTIKCCWDDCERVFFESHQLQDHLFDDHVKSATEESKYSCRWKGCRVYNHPSRNSSCLQQHVVSHSGCKRFPCCFDDCTARFQTESALNRHVSSHLRKQKKATQALQSHLLRITSSSSSSSHHVNPHHHNPYTSAAHRLTTGAAHPSSLAHRRRYKDQTMPLANRHDCMDEYTMERIKYRLVLLKKFQQKSATRRRNIVTTTTSPPTPLTKTTTENNQGNDGSGENDQNRRLAITKTSAGAEGKEEGKDRGNIVSEMFARVEQQHHQRTELEDILFFNRPHKRRRKNKREITEPLIFGGPDCK